MIAYLSQIFTLEPGDLIFTGTPPASAWPQTPRLAQTRDAVEVEIDHLGTLKNPVVAEAR